MGIKIDKSRVKTLTARASVIDKFLYDAVNSERAETTALKKKNPFFTRVCFERDKDWFQLDLDDWKRFLNIWAEERANKEGWIDEETLEHELGGIRVVPKQ